MLDERSEILLGAINEMCAGGTFKIVESDELARLVPGYEGDVGRIVTYLAERRLIELRYAEDDAYCVRTMPEGRSYVERTERERRERAKSRREVLVFSAFGAFIGGMVATFLVFLVRLVFGV